MATYRLPTTSGRLCWMNERLPSHAIIPSLSAKSSFLGWMKVGHGQCLVREKFDGDGYGDGDDDSAGGSAGFRNVTPPEGAEKQLTTVRIATNFFFLDFGRM